MTAQVHSAEVAQEGSLVPEAHYVVECDESSGVLTGINHLQIVVRDMSQGVKFYRDLLGLRLVRTYGHFSLEDFPEAPAVERNYYFALGNGELLILLEIPSTSSPDPSGFPSLWPGKMAPPTKPSKMDHVAFNVDSRERLVWFQQRLIDAGVPVSDVVIAGGAKMTSSIYFYDPSGNPLEIATYDTQISSADDYTAGPGWFDENPVPEILAPNA